jgi:hypothetical protein
VSSKIKSRYGQKRTVTQINDNQFIVEGDAGYLRIGFEIDPSNPTYADFEGGPFLHIGYDFFGKGIVKEIQIIDSDKEDYAMVKVTVDNA